MSSIEGAEGLRFLPRAKARAGAPLTPDDAVFGGPVWSFAVRVYQVAPGHGRGAPAERTLYLSP